MNPQNRNFLKYASQGVEMIATITGLTFLGRWADQKFQNKFPLLTLIGALGGISLALFRVFKSLNHKK
jgi:hypothetical protein